MVLLLSLGENLKQLLRAIILGSCCSSAASRLDVQVQMGAGEAVSGYSSLLKTHQSARQVDHHRVLRIAGIQRSGIGDEGQAGA
ncbi:hypothetical protein [Streptomyces sp. NPDC004680]|uniref:hypothetical protein n=1 Tax=Streptomyces sp. NPDC004680 TaxID=3154287 RepID=UPI0033A850B1